MQNSKSKKLEKQLQDFVAHSEVLKEMTKQQKEMRLSIINQMRDSAVSCGDYLAVLTPCTRQSLDKERLIADHGQSFVDEYMSTTEYSKLEVKAA